MEHETRSSTSKRLDIQALRALAVAAVVLDHLSGWPSGGFVGVDVFFVVSGYLISSLLIRERERTGRISMLGFYSRRARRLFPAAAATILVTLAATFALFPRPRFLEVLTDSGWSAVFLANWHFGQQGTDYFAKDGAVSPLQHFWSLAVEEQFYVVWPLLLIAVLLVFAGRRVTVVSRIAVAVTMAAIVIGSFVVALGQSAHEPTVAYFSTLDRAWELGIGVLVAVAAPLWRRIAPQVGNTMSWIGFALIVASLFLIDSADAFPAPWALLPVLGTAVVLIGGSPEHATAPFPLRNRVVQYLGDISYSLYLWHFPVFIVTVYVAPNAVWFAYIVSVAVAILSYHAIEQPFLRAPGTDRRRWREWRADNSRTFRLSGVAVIAVLAVVSIGLAGVRAEPKVVPQAIQDQIAKADAGDTAAKDASYGPVVQALQTQITEALGATSWPTLAPPVESYLGESKPGSPTNDCANLAHLLPQSECTFGPDTATTKVMLIGDSVAAYERPALESIVESADGSVQLVNRAVWACPFADVQISAPCSDYRSQTIAMVNEVKPDVVVFTNTYDIVAEGGTDLSTAEMTKRVSAYLDQISGSVGKFVFVTPPPQGKVLSDCYRDGGSPADCTVTPANTWLAVLGMYRAIAQQYDAAFVDVRPLVCAGGYCPAFIGDHVVRQDPTHFAYDYAKTLGPAFEELFAEQGVPLIATDAPAADGGAAAAGTGPAADAAAAREATTKAAGASASAAG